MTNDYLTPRDRLQPRPWELKLALFWFAAVAIVCVLMSIPAQAAQIYAAPSLAPASFKVCDGLLKLKKLKGATYATFSQEVPVSGKRAWLTVCAYRDLVIRHQPIPPGN